MTQQQGPVAASLPPGVQEAGHFVAAVRAAALGRPAEVDAALSRMPHREALGIDRAVVDQLITDLAAQSAVQRLRRWEPWPGL